MELDEILQSFVEWKEEMAQGRKDKEKSER